MSHIFLCKEGRGLSSFTLGKVSIFRLKILYNYYFVTALCTTNIYAAMEDLSSYLIEETLGGWEAYICDVLHCFFTFMFLGFVSDIST